MTSPVERSNDLTAREMVAGGPQAMISNLQKGLVRQGRSIKWIIFSVVADVVLSVILGIIIYQADLTASRADRNTTVLQRNSDVAYQTCLNSNQVRAAEKTLWLYIVNNSLFSAPAKNTAEASAQAIQISNLRTYINTNLAPRTCVKTK